MEPVSRTAPSSFHQNPLHGLPKAPSRDNRLAPGPASQNLVLEPLHAIPVRKIETGVVVQVLDLEEIASAVAIPRTHRLRLARVVVSREHAVLGGAGVVDPADGFILWSLVALVVEVAVACCGAAMDAEAKYACERGEECSSLDDIVDGVELSLLGHRGGMLCMSYSIWVVHSMASPLRVRIVSDM